MKAIQMPTCAVQLTSEVASHFDIIEIDPKHEPAAACQMLGPSGWEHAKSFGGIVASMGRPVPLAMTNAPNQQRMPGIVIRHVRLPAEIALEDYARLLFEDEGWQVESMRWLELPVGRRLDVVCRQGSGYLTLLRRVLMFADHGRVLLHESYGLERDWQRWSDSLWCSAATFGLTQPTEDESFEVYTAHARDGLCWELPSSWQVACPMKEFAIEARLIVDKGRVGGYLWARAEVVERLLSEDVLLMGCDRRLRASAMMPAIRKPRVADVEGGELPQGWVGRFESQVSKGPGVVDVTYGFIQRDGLVLSLMAMSETRDVDLMGWLRTRRAFELAAVSLECELQAV